MLARTARRGYGDRSKCAYGAIASRRFNAFDQNFTKIFAPIFAPCAGPRHPPRRAFARRATDNHGSCDPLQQNRRWIIVLCAEWNSAGGAARALQSADDHAASRSDDPERSASGRCGMTENPEFTGEFACFVDRGRPRRGTDKPACAIPVGGRPTSESTTQRAAPRALAGSFRALERARREDPIARVITRANAPRGRRWDRSKDADDLSSDHPDEAKLRWRTKNPLTASSHCVVFRPERGDANG